MSNDDSKTSMTSNLRGYDADRMLRAISLTIVDRLMFDWGTRMVVTGRDASSQPHDDDTYIGEWQRNDLEREVRQVLQEVLQ